MQIKQVVTVYPKLFNDIASMMSIFAAIFKLSKPLTAGFELILFVKLNSHKLFVNNIDFLAKNIKKKDFFL